MNITKSAESFPEIATDLLVVPVGSDLKSKTLDQIKESSGQDVLELAKQERFKGKAGQSFLMRGLKGLQAPRLLLVGLGGGNGELDDVLLAGATAARNAKEIFARRLSVLTADLDTHTVEHLAIGTRLGAYIFDRHISKSEDSFPGFEGIDFLGSFDDSVLEKANHIADGIIIARDLFNETPNILTPAVMADKARTIATSFGLECTIFDETELVKRGFNLITAVGQGSENPPRLIHLTYKPAGEVKKRLAFVGKGVTFDTGGYNLKPGNSMLGMHGDMGGAAAVLGAAHAIGQLKPDGVEIHFVVPTAENSISGRAMRPQDIIKGYGGKTVEIHNTDAEGRLILADALAYIQEFKPDTIIDLATLTGACVVALGEYTAGLFTNDEELASSILKAGATSGEHFWRMPLTKKLAKGLDTHTADMKNIGPRWGGAITAALFLKNFVNMDSWAHLDIAGPAWAEAETPLSPPGGTGFGVATLVNLVRGS